MSELRQGPGWLATRVTALRTRRAAERGARPVPQALPVRRARREAPEWWRGVGLLLLLVPALYAAWISADALVGCWTCVPDAWGPAWYPTDTLAAIRQDLWAWQGRLLPAMLLATILGGAGLLLWESSRHWGRGWDRGAPWPVATNAWVGACAWLAAVACPPAFAVALRAVNGRTYCSAQQHRVWETWSLMVGGAGCALGLLAFLLPMAWRRRSRLVPWFLALGVVAGFGAMGALVFGQAIADARVSKQPIDPWVWQYLGSQLLRAESALGPLLLGVACAWALWRGRRAWLGRAPAADAPPPAAARFRTLGGAWIGATWALCAWRVLALAAMRWEPYDRSWPATLVLTTLLHVLAAALAGLALWHRRRDAARAAEFVAWGTAAQVVSLAAAATGLVGPWRWWAWWLSAAAIWSHLAPAVLVAGLGVWVARLGRRGCPRRSRPQTVPQALRRSRSLHGLPVR